MQYSIWLYHYESYENSVKYTFILLFYDIVSSYDIVFNENQGNIIFLKIQKIINFEKTSILKHLLIFRDRETNFVFFGCLGGGGRPSETCRTETKYEQMFFLHITLSEKGQNNFLMGLKNLVKLGVGIFFSSKSP